MRYSLGSLDEEAKQRQREGGGGQEDKIKTGQERRRSRFVSREKREKRERVGVGGVQRTIREQDARLMNGGMSRK